jgi:hypothetical protein
LPLCCTAAYLACSAIIIAVGRAEQAVVHLGCAASQKACNQSCDSGMKTSGGKLSQQPPFLPTTPDCGSVMHGLQPGRSCSACHADRRPWAQRQQAGSLHCTRGGSHRAQHFKPREHWRNCMAVPEAHHNRCCCCQPRTSRCHRPAMVRG